MVEPLLLLTLVLLLTLLFGWPPNMITSHLGFPIKNMQYSMSLIHRLNVEKEITRGLTIMKYKLKLHGTKQEGSRLILMVDHTIELSIYVGFCLLSKSISSDELGIYTHSFSWLIFMMIKTVGEVQTEMLVLQIFHPRQHLLWHKAGGKPAIVDHNFA